VVLHYLSAFLDAPARADQQNLDLFSIKTNAPAGDQREIGPAK
jgi:hypothetical protein